MRRAVFSLTLRYFEHRREYEQVSLLRFATAAGVRAPSPAQVEQARADMLDARESLSSELAKLDDDVAVQVLAAIAMEKK